MIDDFKKFLLRGNVLDLAVGVIIGGAFNGIVTSLVDNIISPILSIFTGKIDFSSLSFTIPGTAAVIGFGSFLTAIINFIIMGFVIYMLIKVMNRLSGVKEEKEEAAKPENKICQYCKTEIPLDALRCPHCTSELN